MLRPSLQARLSQQLTMTPQLQQAIRLLQLSSLELKAEIQEAFETNPMLETEEEGNAEAASPDHSNNNKDQENGEAKELGNDENLPDELATDSEWDDYYEPVHSTPNTQSSDDYSDYLENQSTQETNSLKEHLIWQIELSSLSNLDLIIAKTIIDALDDSGYLQESLENAVILIVDIFIYVLWNIELGDMGRGNVKETRNTVAFIGSLIID